ncbi:MAG: acetyltransferase [Rhodoglobus sp.]|nr:acetyltransferase [Rhodoglobus sp.]
MPAPDTVDRPSDGDGLRWRAATMDDLEAILDFEREIAAADHPHYTVTREDVANDFEHSYVDLADDTTVVLDDEDRVVAWGQCILSPGQESLVRSIFVGGVRPSQRGRGIGRRLLRWQEQRGLQQLASSDKTLPGWLVSYCDERATSARSMMERFGFEVVRYFLELHRDLSQPIKERAVAPGVRIEQFSPEWSAATLEARNVSFRDHWGSQPVTQEQWSSFTAREGPRNDWSFVAVAPDENGRDAVVGFSIGEANEQDWELQGFSSCYVHLVGVTSAWRKKGIAAALLTRTLLAVRDSGVDQVTLDVDSDSPTGALGLYTGLGFVEAHRSLNLTRVY